MAVLCRQEYYWKQQYWHFKCLVGIIPLLKLCAVHLPRKTKVKLDSKIRIAAVSYLNTLPLLYGIEHSSIISKIDLKSDYPSKIAQWLIDGEVDMGLVPVAVIPQLPQSYIVSDYCIGADGAVSSVCMFSEVPAEEIKTVILDYQSRTSNELAQVLLKDYWKISPDIIYSQEEYRRQISGTTAGVVIGDRAFEQKTISKYHFDLGEAWKHLTGLPFVFAAWISNKPMTEDFIKEFNKANAFGIKHISEVINTIENKFGIDLNQYFSRNIQYQLDDDKREALQKFLQMSQSFNAEPLFERS